MMNCQVKTGRKKNINRLIKNVTKLVLGGRTHVLFRMGRGVGKKKKKKRVTQQVLKKS